MIGFGLDGLFLLALRYIALLRLSKGWWKGEFSFPAGDHYLYIANIHAPLTPVFSLPLELVIGIVIRYYGLFENFRHYPNKNFKC